jgi:hypothetical protein
VSSTVVPRVSASQNGRPGVTLSIQKQADASEVTVSAAILESLPQFEREFPDIQFQVAHVQSTFTEQQVQGVEHTLVEGIILTAIVMLFFLGSWRNAVVVLVAIPTSLGVTLFIMNALGLTLDTISLMAMTLVIGILIDDSTVVLENIERHHAAGESPADAALNGRTEIGTAAIVMTMVDVVVFLPIAFAGGQVGQLSRVRDRHHVATVTSLLRLVHDHADAGWALVVEVDVAAVEADSLVHARFDALRTRYAERWLPSGVAPSLADSHRASSCASSRTCWSRRVWSAKNTSRQKIKASSTRRSPSRRVIRSPDHRAMSRLEAATKEIRYAARSPVRDDDRRRVQRRIRRIRAGRQRRSDLHLSQHRPQHLDLRLRRKISPALRADRAGRDHQRGRGDAAGRRKPAADRRAGLDERRLRSDPICGESLRRAQGHAGNDRRTKQRDERGAADGDRFQPGGCNCST